MSRRGSSEGLLRLAPVLALGVIGVHVLAEARTQLAPPKEPPPADGSATGTAMANAWIDYASRLSDPAAKSAVAQTLDRLGWTAQAAAVRALP